MGKERSALEYILFIGVALFIGLLVIFVLAYIHDLQSVEQDSLSEYEQGFADGKIAGVFEDIKNANKYIEESCICEKDLTLKPQSDNKKSGSWAGTMVKGGKK